MTDNKHYLILQHARFIYVLSLFTVALGILTLFINDLLIWSIIYTLFITLFIFQYVYVDFFRKLGYYPQSKRKSNDRYAVTKFNC